MKLEDYANHGLKYFTEEKQGVWMPSDNAPSHVQRFVFQQTPRVNWEILHLAYRYLATGQEIPTFGTPKHLKWATSDSYAIQHLNELLGQKTPPKTFEDLLAKAYFYEFQRVVNLLRKHYSDLIPINR